MALTVTSIDLCLEENGDKHNTGDYDDNFVVRRGDSFSLKINHEGAFENTNEFSFELRGGGKIIEIKEKAQQDDEFSFQITSKADTSISVSVFVPVDALVSSYQLVLVNGEGSTNPNTVYVIFNPWNKADAVYMEDEELKKEYVLNESGWVYVGGYSPKDWNFAPFDDITLKCTFKLLETASSESRDAAHKVARHMSAMSSEQDNNGVMVGKWAKRGDVDPYIEGKKPGYWSGSKAILKQYLETGEPVKFAQCWVFSGVYTSMMRCLGIPCRSVTNYHSFVDKNGDCMSTSFWDEKWNFLKEESDTFVWNFHVWNDVWMARPDLPAGLGGWQAVDGCPQVLSDGLHQCGPASLQALKEGNVDIPHDTRFLFASVNADEVTYIKNTTTGELKLYNLVADNIGWYIMTKQPNKWDWVDVIGDYKYIEYTMEERAAQMNAMRKMGNPPVEKQSSDIKFSAKVSSKVSHDDTIEVTLTATNDSDRDNTVDVVVVPHVVGYNGVMLKDLEKLSGKEEVKGKSDHTFKFKVDVKESLCTEFQHENVSIGFSFLAKATTEETTEETTETKEKKETLKQYFAAKHVCNIERPTATLKVELVDNAEGKVKSNETMKVKITFPKVDGIDKFTECSIAVDSPLVNDTDFQLNDSEVNDGFLEKSFQIKAIKSKKEKEAIFNVVFSSQEISGVHGSMRVTASM